MAAVLADRARDFAKTYVTLVEALQREGVLEEQARIEARLAATTVLMVGMERPTVGSTCPLCSR